MLLVLNILSTLTRKKALVIQRLSKEHDMQTNSHALSSIAVDANAIQSILKKLLQQLPGNNLVSIALFYAEGIEGQAEEVLWSNEGVA